MARKTKLITVPDYLPAGLIREVSPEFIDWLTKADTVHLNCRVAMHWWPDISDPVKTRTAKQKTGVVQIIAYCQRNLVGCGVKRTQVTNPYGILGSGSSYDYSGAPGYQFHRGNGAGWGMTKEERGAVRLTLQYRREHGDAEALTA